MIFDSSIPEPTAIFTEADARYWCDRFYDTHDRHNGLGLDTETSGLVRRMDRAIVWSLSDGKNRLCIPAAYLPIFREKILENPEINFDLTNAPFDGSMLANCGIDISKAGELRCTLIQGWLLNENNRGRNGLKESIKDRFGRTALEFSDVFGKIPPQRRDAAGRVTTKTVAQLIYDVFNDPNKFWMGVDYSSLDAYDSLVLRIRNDEDLDKITMWEFQGQRYSLKNHFYAIEVPFTKLLFQMERRGIMVDMDYFNSLRAPMETRLSEIETLFNKEFGEPLNLKATVDVREFFHGHLKKPVHKWTKGGASGNKQPSTDEEVLKFWAEEQGDPWAQLLMEHRGIAKTKGTYVDGLTEWIDPEIGNFRIRTSIRPTLVTGRLGSTDPNLLALPRPKEDKWKIRKAFIAAPRRKFIVVDYEQLEMRICAFLSGDKKMIDAINTGIDIHCLTVSELDGVPYSEVMAAKNAEGDIKKGKRGPLTKREEDLIQSRQDKKTAGFGILYGIGGQGLSVQLNASAKPDTMGRKRFVTPDDGNRLIQQWFSVFPTVKDAIDRTRDELKRNGYVQTIMGRFRRLGDIRTMTREERSRAERQSFNARIQGSAADIAKKAMLRCDAHPRLRELDCRILLQIHDELIFEPPEEHVEECKTIIRPIMEHPFEGSDFVVPLPVSVGSGANWAEAK